MLAPASGRSVRRTEAGNAGVYLGVGVRRVAALRLGLVGSTERWLGGLSLDQGAARKVESGELLPAGDDAPDYLRDGLAECVALESALNSYAGEGWRLAEGLVASNVAKSAKAEIVLVLERALP